MEIPYRYIGCFLDKAELDAATASLRHDTLAKEIVRPHVTFVFRPTDVDETLIGKPIRVKAVGYGNNGENEGLLVEVYADDAALTEMIGDIDTPHITLSVSENGAAVNTRFLSFSPIEPFWLSGVFDGAY